MENASIEHAIRLAQERWPTIEWRVKTNDEACSPCPWCGGEDRFVLWISGYYMCRAAPGHCGREGWLDEDQQHTWTPDELRLRRIESEQVRLRRQVQAQETRIEALERMARCRDHERYHENLVRNEEAFEWFIQQGFQAWAIFDYKLGLCPRCPTDREGRTSYTLPIWRKDGPLWSIRHRLQGATNGDKYRPHRKNLGRQLVNARLLSDWADRVICVEGAKKARVLQQYDLPVVGILGKTGFEMRWLSWFHPAASIYLALDPDASDAADRLGHDMAKAGKEVYVANLLEKPDDMLINGGTVDELESYISFGRRVH
jgi:hypothetical protein